MKRVIQTIAGLALLAAILWLIWWLGALIFSALVAMDGDTRGATIALVGVISVPVITFATQFSMEKRRSREQAMREKRTQFYETVIKIFMDMLSSSRVGKTPSNPQQWVDQMNALTPQMILYGSKDFVRSWNTFRAVSAANTKPGSTLSPEGSMRMVASMEKMMIAARRDLGHRVTSVDYGDYAATFINDLDRSKIKLAYQQINAKRYGG